MKPVDKAVLKDVIEHSPFAPSRQATAGDHSGVSNRPGVTSQLFAAFLIVVGAILIFACGAQLLDALFFGEGVDILIGLTSLGLGAGMMIGGVCVNLLHRIRVELWSMHNSPK